MLELGIPAMWLAGLAASPHCGLMCGPLQQLGLRRLDAGDRTRMLLALHLGRVLGYAVLGALSGALGLLLLRALPSPRLGLVLQGFAAVLLIVYALRVWQQRLPACCQAPRHTRGAGGALRGLSSGLGWALMPCAPLYLALGAAAMSGSALQGAALLAAFAFGTLPLLAASGWGLAHLQWRAAPRLAPVLGLALPLAIALSGLAGIALAPAFHSMWCLP